MLMADNMRNSMYELQRIVNVVQEISTQYDRLFQKKLLSELNEKESAQFELLEHLSTIYHKG